MANSTIIDVSGYQDSSTTFMKKLKSKGAAGVIVKLTEGTSYTNPKAAAQVKNAYATFGVVGAYHFYHGSPTAEAAYFLKVAKSMGLDTSTWLAIDVESTSLTYYTTTGVNIFLKHLHAAGYHNLMVYGSASWFKEGRIKQSSLPSYAKIWCAAYNNTAPGIDNVDLWQHTDNWKSLSVDASIDFKDIMQSNSSSSTSATPTYYKVTGLYEVTASMIHAYNKLPLKGDGNKRYVRWAKGSRFYATAVKNGSIYSLKTKIGYCTANKDLVKLVKKL